MSSCRATNANALECGAEEIEVMAARAGEVVVYVPRTGRVELAPAPAPGEPVRLYGGRR